jgi:pyruvate kinase
MLFTDFLDIESLPIGAKLIFDHSEAELTVSKNEKSTDGLVTATVTNPGTIPSDAMIRFREYTPHINFVTERDRRDIIWAINNGIHTIVLAHTATSSDIEEVRHFLALNDGKQMKIFFKVQNLDCIKNYDDILAVAD